MLHEPSSNVTVWLAESPFVHSIAWPAVMLRPAGKAKPLISAGVPDWTSVTPQAADAAGAPAGARGRGRDAGAG